MKAGSMFREKRTGMTSVFAKDGARPIVQEVFR